MTALVTLQRPVADDLLAHLHDPRGFAWLRDGDGLIGSGRAFSFDPGTGAGRFDRAVAALTAWFADAGLASRRHARGGGAASFVSFTFDPEAPGSSVVVPEVVFGRWGGTGWVTSAHPGGVALGPVEPLPHPPRVRYAGSTAEEVRWLEAVDEAVRRIRVGRLAKVVLARDVQVWAERPLDARAIARRLSERFPGCHTFLHDGFVGATPETLLRRRGRSVSSLVLAGSARRGTTAEEDRRLGAALLASAKDREEHAISVASVREPLEVVTTRLRVDPEPWLLRLDNIQHLATAVSGELADDLHVLQLCAALHPTAAVCGAPRETALHTIRELEALERAGYAGPVGWVDAAGDGELGIALRCAEVSGNRARLFAGVGVVADSLPEAELEETRLKLLAMQSALGG